MHQKKKSREEIEAIALDNLRHRKDRKLLNNTNVDCFIDGYILAQNTLLNKPFKAKDFLEDILEGINWRLKSIEETAGYSGRYYTKEEVKDMDFMSKVHSALTEILRETDT